MDWSPRVKPIKIRWLYRYARLGIVTVGYSGATAVNSSATHPDVLSVVMSCKKRTN